MPIISWNVPAKATADQLHYIECLAIDLLFDRHQRNAHVSSIISRKIEHLDELTKVEASKVITQFKEWKEKDREE